VERRPFGATGLEVPVLGFGAMQVGDPELPEAQAGRLLNHALDLGLTLIDTARSYGVSEERIGRHLAGRRDEFVLSTKVGYGVDGVTDWTFECVVAGVDAARDRLRTDVIDIVHLHSCGMDTLEAGEVVRALQKCEAAGKLRVVAYSGDSGPLRHAVASGDFAGVQASVNLCDQQSLRVLAEARACGIGTIAKRPLAGRPWHADAMPSDVVHAEYRRRFAALRAAPDVEADVAPADWESLALRFAAFEPGVDCVIVGGTNAAHLARNAAAVANGALAPGRRAAIREAFMRLGPGWEGLV
jgi:aryl-alcohol dehydrogenase-like predicted oxidoreductase